MGKKKKVMGRHTNAKIAVGVREIVAVVPPAAARIGALLAAQCFINGDIGIGLGITGGIQSATRNGGIIFDQTDIIIYCFVCTYLYFSAAPQVIITGIPTGISVDPVTNVPGAFGDFEFKAAVPVFDLGPLVAEAVVNIDTAPHIGHGAAVLLFEAATYARIIGQHVDDRVIDGLLGRGCKFAVGTGAEITAPRYGHTTGPSDTARHVNTESAAVD